MGAGLGEGGVNAAWAAFRSRRALRMAWRASPSKLAMGSGPLAVVCVLDLVERFGLGAAEPMSTQVVDTGVWQARRVWIGGRLGEVPATRGFASLPPRSSPLEGWLSAVWGEVALLCWCSPGGWWSPKPDSELCEEVGVGVSG